jgi:tetratricopeptide (TPR) repeat protein
MKQQYELFKKLRIILLVMFTFSGVTLTFAQNLQNDKELAQATAFMRQNRYIDALPLLEKAAKRYPDDGEIHANLGVAILANSTTIKDENLRKKEVARAGEILKKANKLGTENVLALHYIDLLEQGLDVDSVSDSSSKEVEDAIREGEGFFGRGEFDKAFLAYQRASKLDPKSYEAAVFAGDCFYAQKKYKESEIWFAKAVAINPNREQAHRFWGDALVNQGKGREALVKFANAFIAEPTSRLTWDTFLNAVKNHGTRKTSPFVILPSEEQIGNANLVVDTKLLSAEDGTDNWNRFTETRAKQIENFNKVANGRIFEPTVSEDVEALKNVVVGLKSSRQKGVKLSKSMENLIAIDNLGMLDFYTIMIIHGGDSCSEYEAFRDKNRARMEKFLVEYFAEDKQELPKLLSSL